MNLAASTASMMLCNKCQLKKTLTYVNKSIRLECHEVLTLSKSEIAAQ